jgi:ubiquinone biosynthesis protein COQ9
MSDFTKLQKDKILNYLFKNFKKIDFDNIDQDISLKKIDDLHFFDKQELLIKISDLLFEDLDKKFLSEVKSKVNKISKTNEKISFLLNKRFQIEKKNKDLIKIFLIHLIKSNNSNKVLNYIYSVADIMWKHSNDRSVDFNYYTKRLILSSVYLKILILTFYKDNLTQKDLDKEILKSLEHVKLISQFKIKLDFLKNIKEFFSMFSIQKSRARFLKDFS